MVHNKVFSAINIVGLALGMASSLLIFLWIQDELSVGRQYTNAANMYRVMENEIADDRIVTDEDTPGILADELKRQLHKVQYAAGLSSKQDNVLTVGDKLTTYFQDRTTVNIFPDDTIISVVQQSRRFN